MGEKRLLLAAVFHILGASGAGDLAVARITQALGAAAAQLS
jgi:hypothetical protein